MQYDIYRNHEGKIVAVKNGFSWPAFFFGAIWMYVKRMWVEGTLYLAAFFTIGFLFGPLPDWVGISAAIVLGFLGNELREKNLVLRGYDHVGSVEHDNHSADGAIARFVKEEENSRQCLDKE